MNDISESYENSIERNTSLFSNRLQRYFKTFKLIGFKNATGSYEETNKFPLGDDILHIEKITGYLDYGDHYTDIPNNMVCMVNKDNEVYLRYTGDYSKVLEAYVTVTYMKKNEVLP